MNLIQYKHNIVVPALALLPDKMNSQAAVNLVTGTALVESNLDYIVQLGGGPALGFLQMEPATHDDCWRWLHVGANSWAASSIYKHIAGRKPSSDMMIYDLYYSVMMTRVKYYMSKFSLPEAQDAQGLATMHKNIYNTAAGAAVIRTNIPKFQQAIDA